MAFEALKLAALVSGWLTVVVGLPIILLDTVSVSSLKDIITGRAAVTFAKKIWNGFLSKFFVLFFVGGTLLFWLPSAQCLTDIQKEKEGLCKCNCKKCQETAMKVDAVIQYLNLDKEDIEDLLLQKKAEDAEASEVAIPQVK